MKYRDISANAVLTVLLILSAGINIKLGHKVKTQQRDLTAVQGRMAKEASIVGVKLTEMHVKTQDGQPKTLQFAQNDPPTILYVLRAGCGWCAKNLNNIKELNRQVGTNGNYRVVGLAIDDTGLKEYMQKTQLSFPVYSGVSSEDVERLKLGGTPETIVVANGQVTHTWSGAYNGTTMKDIEATLRVTLPGLS